MAVEVERETGIKPNLYPRALGSLNLNSDLDFSTYGVGAERVVELFSQEFRALKEFKRLESGFVFDTNVYTQAVYELFDKNLLTGKSLGLANGDLDAVRQLMYEEMAVRKYAPNLDEWSKYKSGLLSAAPDTATKKMLSSTFEEAEYAFSAARSRIAKKLGVNGDAALHAAEGTNAMLAATNDAYVEVLRDIGQWRKENTRLQQLWLGEVSKLREPTAEFLERYPGWRYHWEELNRLKKSGDTAAFETLARATAFRGSFSEL